jgi:D-alanyl-D-alanine carboxypeptidase
MRRGFALLGTIVVGTALGAPAAAHVLADLSEGEILEAVDGDAPLDGRRAADLLLVWVLRERVATGALTLAGRASVLPDPADSRPVLDADGNLELGELLQLLLLTGSRTAVRSLAEAVGPGLERTRARMLEAASRLRLAATALPDDWPAAPPTARAGERGATTAVDLVRLGAALARDGEIARRLALDGVPVADGAQIVRASAPLIAVAPPPAARGTRPNTGPALALARREGLELLAVAAGPEADAAVWRVLENGFARYERVTVVHAGQAVGPEVRVRGGIVPRFSAVAAEPFAITARRGSHPRLVLSLQLPRTIDAPLEMRQAVGELVVHERDRLVAVVPLVAPRTIAPSGWLDTARR